MSNKPQSSFLDPKSIIAILLVGVSWFFWDGYMKKKYPHLYTQKTEQTQDAKKVDGSKSPVDKSVDEKESQAIGQINSDDKKVAVSATEKIYSFQSENLNFEISNYGMGIKNIYLNKYLDRDKQVKQINTDLSTKPFESRVIGEDDRLIFAIEKLSDTRYKGVANYKNSTITKIVDINAENYSLKIKVKSENIDQSFKGLKFFVTAEIDEDSGSSLLMPTLGGQELFVKYENTSERLLGASIGETKLNVKNANIVNLGETYFSLALMNESNTIPTFTNFMSGKEIRAQLSYPVLNYENKTQELILDAFIGPKDVNILGSIHPELLEVIDYGWFDLIARFLLRFLKFLNGFIGNWGVSIVVMTLFIKIILLPLNIVSFKSMKRMQKVQPQIKEIRAKYKDKPQEMNMKVMALMKEQKANPLSGCLPTLLQFPIFFALYRVLGQSIELYQAPFMLWIQDLSLKDPFYILPVLMGIAMFFQMKISPSTMDPTQKKIMMFMPIMFSLFMLALPSGLTLYIFVSTLFGIIQHFILMRDPAPEPVLSKVSKA